MGRKEGIASDALKKKIEKAEAHLAEVQAENEAAMRRKKIKCEECEEPTPIKNLTLIAVHGWDYSGGAYCEGAWYPTHHETKYDCPKCGHENRSIDREEEFEEKGPYFGKHDKEHRGGPFA